MHVGTAKVDITPQGVVELSGFLARTQPSTGVLDPIFVRALHLESRGVRLLWLVAEVLGFEADFVTRFRRWASRRLGLPASHVILSATHTHAAPATMRLINAGEYEAAYVERLYRWMQDAARAAAERAGAAELVAGEAACALGIDRRGKPTKHTDPRLAALGWRRADGTWAAVLANYAIHNVALGAVNRKISGDVTGHAAAILEASLPGAPVVLWTIGGSGNVNPPDRDRTQAQVHAFGGRLADAARAALAAARPPGERLRVRAATMPLPLDVFDAPRIARHVRGMVAGAGWGSAAVRRRLIDAVHRWGRGMTRLVRQGRPPRRTVRIAAVAFGDLWFAGLSAEVFSRMAERLRELTGQTVYVAGYTGGVFGYLPTAEAMAEGGYEPDQSFIFYNSMPVKADAFERIARRAARLVGGP